MKEERGIKKRQLERKILNESVVKRVVNVW